jgi:hypothetical protein
MNKPVISKEPTSVQFTFDPEAKRQQESGGHEPPKTPTGTVSQQEREAQGRRFGKNLQNSFQNFKRRMQPGGEPPKVTDDDHHSRAGANQPWNAQGGSLVPGAANGIFGQLSSVLKLPDYLLKTVQEEMTKWAPGGSGQTHQGQAPASGTVSSGIGDGQNGGTGAQRPWEGTAPNMVLGIANRYFRNLATAGVPHKMLTEAYGLMMDHMPQGAKQALQTAQPPANDTPKTTTDEQGPQNVSNSSPIQQDGFTSVPLTGEPPKDSSVPVDSRTTAPGSKLLENRLRTALGDVKSLNSAADPGVNQANLQDTLKAGFKRMQDTPYIAESLEDHEKEAIDRHLQNLSVSNPDQKHIDEARGFLGAMAHELAVGVKESFEAALRAEPDEHKREATRQKLSGVLEQLDEIAEETSAHAGNGSSATGGSKGKATLLDEMDKQTKMAKEVAAAEEKLGLVQVLMSMKKKAREMCLQLI